MKKILYLLVVILLALCVCLFSTYTPCGLFARCYCGNRIVINIYAKVDGKRAEMNLNDTFLSENDCFVNANNKSKLVKKSDKYILRCRTNEYGSHKFYVLINNQYNIVINTYQWNWWDIQKINLYIDINTKNNTITYNDEHYSLNESAKNVYYKSKKITNVISSYNYIWAGVE